MIPPRDAEVISHSCDRDAYHIDCAADIENISAERRPVAGEVYRDGEEGRKEGLILSLGEAGQHDRVG